MAGIARTSPEGDSRTAVLPAVLPAPRSPRYYSLDMWRGIACLMVVVFHATFYAREVVHPTGGLSDKFLWMAGKLFIGVPLFFVISGYCISAAADTARRRQNTVPSYFRRRFRRIYPPFWVAVLGAVGLVLVGEWLRPGLFTDKIHPVSHPMSLSLSQWLGNITLTETWRHHLIGDQRFLFMGPTFTLCYEEQFYAVTGLLLLVTRRRFFVAAGVATILSVLFAALCSRRGIAINGFFFDGKWLLFAIGILVYYRLNYASGRQIWLAEGLLLLSIVYGFRQLHYDNSFLVAFGFAFLLARVHRWDEAWANSRIVRPFAFCGTLCYSLYLIHWPIAKALSHGMYLLGVRSAVGTLLITLPLCLAVSITVAWLFHLAVERRFMNTVPKSRDTARSKQSGVSPGVQVPQIRPAPASAAVAQPSGAAIESGAQ